jgi:protein TonB
MFEQSLLDLQTTKTKTKYTVLISTIVECIGLGIFILIPLIHYEILPAYQLSSYLVAPPPPPPPAPPPPVVKVQKIIPKEFDAGKLIQPKVIPKKVQIIEESETPPSAAIAGVVGGVPGGVAGGSIGGVIGGIISSAPVAPPPPPKVEAPKAVAPQRIRVGGNVQKANLINAPKPVYPPLAKQARIQGTVKLNAIIDKEGNIQQLTVVSGHPLLIPSALEAVKQWKYKPTLLNGEPVEVITQIDVNFTLSS